MILIIGGAFQGKRDFARSRLGIAESDIFTCTGTQIDTSAACIDALEEFCLACVREGIEPLDRIRPLRSALSDKVLICQDIFCGVVPVDPELREWRQATGRLCSYLSGEADRVSRIICGLEQRLK